MTLRVTTRYDEWGGDGNYDFVLSAGTPVTTSVPVGAMSSHEVRILSGLLRQAVEANSTAVITALEVSESWDPYDHCRIREALYDITLTPEDP